MTVDAVSGKQRPAKEERGPRFGRPTRILPPLVTGHELTLAAFLAVLWAVLAVATTNFFSSASLEPLLSSVAPVALIGIGMTVVMVVGGIDVSVGAGVLVTSVVTARLMIGLDLPMLVAIAVALVTGGLLGLLNGVLVAFGRVHAIIVTFGTANLLLFIGYQALGPTYVNNIPGTFNLISGGPSGRTFGLPHSFLLTVVIALAATWYLRNLPGGRHFYAIGGDPKAAQLAGVNTNRRLVLAYVSLGVAVGLASCFTIGLGSGTLTPAVGNGMELQAIAAAVIGGTSVTGGRGSVIGTVLGAVLVQTVESGNTQLGWMSGLADLFVGVVMVAVVAADLLRDHASAKGALR